MEWDNSPKHQKNPIKAIRQMCIACMGGGRPFQSIEKCSTLDCPLHPFRFGKNPFRKPPSEKQKQARAANLSYVVSKPKDFGA